MPTFRDEAIVLMRLDYSESSQVLVYFTRDHGKIRAIAKGIRRGTKTRFAAGIDLLDIGHLVFSCREERAPGLVILTEWKQSKSLSGLRDRLMRLHTAQYAVEITSHLTEDWDSHQELYDALINVLDQIAEANDPLDLAVQYQTALLDAIGSLPRFDGCVMCSQNRQLTHFSAHEGGMICRSCEGLRVEKIEVGPKTLGLLKNSSTGYTNTQSTVGAFTVLNYHISHLMDREPLLTSKLVSETARRMVY